MTRTAETCPHSVIRSCGQTTANRFHFFLYTRPEINIRYYAILNVGTNVLDPPSSETVKVTFVGNESV